MLDLEQQIFKQIEKSKSILITFSSTQDSDAVASALALFLFLKNKGHVVEIAGTKIENKKDSLHFLPNHAEIQDSLKNLRRFIVSLNTRQTKVSQIKYAVEKHQLNFIVSPEKGWFENKDVSTKTSNFKYDLIITIGATDLEALGGIYDNNIEFFYKTPVINIDHQPANEEFGQINFVDLNAAANSEILFYLLKNYHPKNINEDIATCLLAGIIHKTKNFKSAKLTPRTLLSTSDLISIGARREEIIDHLYRSRDLSVLKLWGKILNNLKSENNSQLIWARISLNDFQEAQANEEVLVDIIDELISSVPSAKLIVLLLERSSETTKMFIYSPKNLNVLEIMAEYNPRGNIKIAQIDLKQDIDTACIEAISSVKIRLEKLSS